MSHEENTGHVDWLQAKRFALFLAVIFLLISCFVWLYFSLLFPILFSLFLTFLLSPVVDKLTVYIPNRGLSAFALLLLVSCLLLLATMEIISPLYQEVLDLVKKGPEVIDVFVKQVVPSGKNFLLQFSFINENFLDLIVKRAIRLISISEQLQDALLNIWRKAPRLVALIMNFILIPLLTFFMLKDEKRIAGYCLAIIPLDLHLPIRLTLNRIANTLRAVLMGQVTVALILTVLYLLGFNLIGLQTASVIALVSGFCRIIPYLDILVGSFLSIIVIFSDFQGFHQFFWVGLVIFIVQSIDAMFITPRILGGKVGLHPAVVILSVLAFADLMGFWGVLLAIPIVAVTKSLLLGAKPFYLKSSWYHR